MTITTAAQISELVREHETWRAKCMNMIASENALSPAVLGFLSSDLEQRYGNYLGRNLEDRRHAGSRYLGQIEGRLARIIKDVFGAPEAELRAISGHVAGLAVIMGLCRPGDTVLELSRADGGHRLAAKAAECPLVELEVLPIPFDAQMYNIDVDATSKLIVEREPRLVILGSSNFLFPHPVKDLAACLPSSPRTVLAYDASHVFGLIACGEFQNPLGEGAHVVFGSTHKTLPGPQGGLILSNDPSLMNDVSLAVYPGLVTNHHLTRSPALAVALMEMSANKAYARQVISNAQALGKGLSRRGLPVVGASCGFSKSHTVLIAVASLGTGRTVATLLEESNIMTSYTPLPECLGSEGVRLGTAEVTRHGADEKDIDEAANIIADVVLGQLSPSDARVAVRTWAAGLKGLQFAET